MFKFLKEKLKQGVSIFSKKVDDSAEEEILEEPPKQEEVQKEEKPAEEEQKLQADKTAQPSAQETQPAEKQPKEIPPGEAEQQAQPPEERYAPEEPSKEDMTESQLDEAVYELISDEDRKEPEEPAQEKTKKPGIFSRFFKKKGTFDELADRFEKKKEETGEKPEEEEPPQEKEKAIYEKQPMEIHETAATDIDTWADSQEAVPEQAKEQAQPAVQPESKEEETEFEIDDSKPIGKPLTADEYIKEFEKEELAVQQAQSQIKEEVKPKPEKKQEPQITEKKEPVKEEPITPPPAEKDKEDHKKEEEAESKKAPLEEPKKGFFRKLTEKVVTKKISSEKFDSLFWELEVILLENNIAVEVIEKIKEDLRNSIVDKPIKRNKIEDTILISLKNSIQDVLSSESFDIIERSNAKKPYVICFIGINGSGKTTTIAKVAKMFLNKNKKIVLAAADTFRAAAIDQLQVHANNLGVKMIKHDYGSDPAAVAFDAIKYAQAKDIDAVLIDTAGRLHSNTNLIDEMKKIIRVANPDLKIFVGEAITGNDCVEQAVKFNEAIDIDGIILSKADVDEKGGASISVSYVTKKPILYIGTGQGYTDIKPFDRDEVVKSLGLEA